MKRSIAEIEEEIDLTQEISNQEKEDFLKKSYQEDLKILQAELKEAQKPAGKPKGKEPQDHLEESLAKGYITQEEYEEAKAGKPKAKIELTGGKTFAQIKSDLDVQLELGMITEEEYAQKIKEAKGEKTTQPPKKEADKNSPSGQVASPLEKKYAECLAQIEAFKAEKDTLERKQLADQARAKGEKITLAQAKEMPKTELRQKAGQDTNTITPREGKERAIENLVKWELKGNKVIKDKTEKLEGEQKTDFIKKRDALIEEAKNEIKKATQRILDELETKLKAIL